MIVEELPMLKSVTMVGIQDRQLTLKFLTLFSNLDEKVHRVSGVQARLLDKHNKPQVDEARLELRQLKNTNWTHSFKSLQPGSQYTVQANVYNATSESLYPVVSDETTLKVYTGWLVRWFIRLFLVFSNV